MKYPETEGGYAITGISSKTQKGKVVVPAEINGKPVVRTGEFEVK